MNQFQYQQIPTNMNSPSGSKKRPENVWNDPWSLVGPFWYTSGYTSGILLGILQDHGRGLDRFGKVLGAFFKSFAGAWSLLGTTSDRRPPQYCFTPPRAQWAEVYSKYSGRTANGAMCTLGAAHRDSKVEGRVTLTPTPPTCTVIPLMHASTHNHIWKSMDSYQ